ncbi:poly(ethylene terephthalate) hydrolase family protein [Streptomyces specialis]|uniref:poly(ethylene terephthalate) hydrolase family protein n=1 Tax=Streptomyces specialis TaxID=498367 RepID=UPI00073F5EBD|nr:alpha/beta hydrolase [Streptomyces specialis]
MAQHRVNRRDLLRMGAAVATATAATVALAPGATAAATDPTAAWNPRGPYPVDTVKTDLTTYHYPRRPAGATTTFPVVLWGNGTFVTPGMYEQLLKHWAGHGFIVAAANTVQANNGDDMLAGLDDLTTKNGTSGSPFHRLADLNHVVAVGHSQGGAGAINAARDERVTSILPLQPGPLASTTDLRVPMLLLVGSEDRIVSPDTWVLNSFYAKSSAPTLYASLRDANHFASVNTDDGGRFRGLTTAWLLATAKANAAARHVFGGDLVLERHPDYTEVRRNDKARQAFAAW